MLRIFRVLLISPLLFGAFFASAASAQILNSERIEQTFGSYGIDVFYSDATHRLSNLYSEHDGRRVMRTFAIVGLPMSVDGALAAPHQAILDGGSIGATFKSAGWDVVKRNLAIEQITAVEELAVQLEIAAGSKVAMHAYELEVERAGDRYFYATIIEMHHPDYLDLSSLEDIYAELGPYDGPPKESVHHLALEGVSRLASLNLSLSQ